MIDGDQGGVHLAVALAADRLPVLGMPRAARAFFAQQVLSDASIAASASERVRFLRSVSYSWMRFSLVTGLAMIVLAYVGHLLVGKSGGTAGIAIGGGIGFFFLTGAVYSTWKTVWAVWAQFRARRYGTQDAGYLRAMARSRLHDSSLAAQAVVGAVTFYLVVTLL
jgi:hypothetical protein